MFAIKHILVPTDFSETSELALAAAVELARTFGAMEKAAQVALEEVQARTRTMAVETDSVLEIGAEREQITSAWPAGR